MNRNNTYKTDIQLSERYQVNRTTIWRWAREQKFPKPKHFNGCSRWLLSDVEKWELNNEK